MSIEFGFMAGPATTDGPMDDLYEAGRLRPEFMVIPDIGIPRYEGTAAVEVLGLNSMGLGQLNEVTAGRFVDFIGGAGNSRYVRLAPKMPLLIDLKTSMAAIGPNFPRLFLTVFIENCEHALTAHGDQALLLVY